MGEPARQYMTYPEIRAKRLAEIRARGLDALRRADDLVRAAGGRMLVFGSFAIGAIHERSDIDVALFDLPDGTKLDISTEVFFLFGEAGFDADVVIAQHAGRSLLARIAQDGKPVADLG